MGDLIWFEGTVPSDSAISKDSLRQLGLPVNDNGHLDTQDIGLLKWVVGIFSDNCRSIFCCAINIYINYLKGQGKESAEEEFYEIARLIEDFDDRVENFD